MTIFTLYHFTTCPLSRIARICLNEKNQSFKLIIEKPWEFREEFLRLNPAATIPVLLIDNTIIIRGIYPIVEFLEECDIQPKLLIGDAENRAHIRFVFNWFVEKFYDEVTKYILSEKIMRVLHTSGSPHSTAIRAAKKNMIHHLDYLSHLLINNTYLCGERITIADCAAAAQLSIVDLVSDIEWKKYPKIKAWYALMKSRPSFHSILQDEISGIITPTHYRNPDF